MHVAPSRTLPVLLSSFLLAAVATGPAHAQPKDVLAAPQAHVLPCKVLGTCGTLQRRMTFPAGALSYAGTSIAPHARGLQWNRDGSGVASLTVRTPPDYAGGSVRLVLFHEYVGTGSVDGTFGFVVTPLGLRHGNSFETYGSWATNMLSTPGTGTIVYQQSVTLSPSGEFPATAEWWYFDIVRTGTDDSPLRLMSVAIEY